MTQQQRRGQGGDQNRGESKKGGRPFMELFVSGSRDKLTLSVRLTYNNRVPTYEHVVTFWLGTEDNPFQDDVLDPKNPELRFTLNPGQQDKTTNRRYSLSKSAEPIDLSGYDTSYSRITTECEGIQSVWKPLPPSKPKTQGTIDKDTGRLQVNADVDEHPDGTFHIRINTQSKKGRSKSESVIVRCNEDITLEASIQIQLTEIVHKREYTLTTASNGKAVIVASFQTGFKRHPRVELEDGSESKTIDLVKSNIGS